MSNKNILSRYTYLALLLLLLQLTPSVNFGLLMFGHAHWCLVCYSGRGSAAAATNPIISDQSCVAGICRGISTAIILRLPTVASLGFGARDLTCDTTGLHGLSYNT